MAGPSRTYHMPQARPAAQHPRSVGRGPQQATGSHTHPDASNRATPGDHVAERERPHASGRPVDASSPWEPATLWQTRPLNNLERRTPAGVVLGEMVADPFSTFWKAVSGGPAFSHMAVGLGVLLNPADGSPADFLISRGKIYVFQNGSYERDVTLDTAATRATPFAVGLKFQYTKKIDHLLGTPEERRWTQGLSMKALLDGLEERYLTSPENSLVVRLQVPARELKLSFFEPGAVPGASLNVSRRTVRGKISVNLNQRSCKLHYEIIGIRGGKDSALPGWRVLAVSPGAVMIKADRIGGLVKRFEVENWEGVTIEVQEIPGGPKLLQSSP